MVEAAGVAPAASRSIEVWHQNDARQLDDLGAAFMPSDDWLWTPRPGAEYQGDVVNGDGYRGAVIARDRGERVRVVTLGDSSTFGFGVPDEKCFARRLEQSFADTETPIEVLNLGCIGFSAVQAREIYRKKARRYRPDLVIVAVGAVNEHFLVPPGQSDSEKLRLLEGRGGKVLRWLRRFSTVRWIESWIRDSEAYDPVADVVLRGSSQDWRPRVSLEEFSFTLAELAHMIARDGAKLLVVVPPKREDVDRSKPVLMEYQAALRAFAAERQLPIVDVYTRFRELDHADPSIVESPLMSPRFMDPYHPSELGHRLYAEILVEAIGKYGLLSAPRERRP